MIGNALVKLIFLNLNFFLFFLSPPSFSMLKAFPPFRFVLVHFSPSFFSFTSLLHCSSGLSLVLSCLPSGEGSSLDVKLVPLLA